ncbi:MAG: AGE family epimerase/isomerase, partial [Treponema sp.]|nr:AGE family epimerase/isomerase [Treponema sp.]
NFLDIRSGGMFWSVKTDGSPLVSRKQIYGNAFALYALSEYAAAVKEVLGREGAARYIMGEAVRLFGFLEDKARDKEYGGYWEALGEDWNPTTETKLSEKDIDCDKSMNTNLHVMEAYTNLYRTLPVVFPEMQDGRQDAGVSAGAAGVATSTEGVPVGAAGVLASTATVQGTLKAALEALVRVHVDKILDRKDWHLDLYFNKDWSQTGEDEISYGHDIEASWLLWEAAEVLGDGMLKDYVRPVAIAIADTALREGFDAATGGFEDKLEPDGTRRTVRVWWNQSEALNGFYNAWKMTGEEKYADAVEKVWAWVKAFQLDKENGEWFQEVTKEGRPCLDQVKGGNWKTSYHNARCCMELLRRSGK